MTATPAQVADAVARYRDAVDLASRDWQDQKHAADRAAMHNTNRFLQARVRREVAAKQELDQTLCNLEEAAQRQLQSSDSRAVQAARATIEQISIARSTR